MIKKTIIDDPTMYVKSRESGLRTDYYFNRKACENSERGHFATVNEEIVFVRSARP